MEIRRTFITILSGIILMFGISALNAQTYLVNNNSYIVVSAGSQINVGGNFVNQNNGIVNNQDTIIVTGNWTNNAANHVFQGTATGTVVLKGAAQTIGGTGQTWFHNLIAGGTGNKVLGVNTRAAGIVALNDKEINTGAYQFYIDNTSLSAITRTTGYVNTISGGWLIRAMNSASAYSFPVGKSAFYRPLDITPASAVADTFGIRFYDHSPSVNGFDVNQKQTTICTINPNYYHQIAKGQGSLAQAGITMYFDSLVDGNYNRIAHWQVIPQWQNTLTPVINYQSSPNFSTISITGWSSFNPFSFALAKYAPDATITAVAPVCANAAPFSLVAATPGGTWSGTGITDPVNGIFNPSVAGVGTHMIHYNISSILGCISADSIAITVLGLPGTPVSPHGPGSLCQGTVSSSYTSSATGASYYIWTISPVAAGTISGTGTTGTVTWNPNFSGTATVCVYAASACDTSSSNCITVSVDPLPVAGFTDVVNDPSATFTNTSLNAASYNWSFGDGTASIALSPSHTYTHDGTFIIQLIATNPCGTDTAWDTIQIFTVGIAEVPAGSLTVFPNPFGSSTFLKYVLTDPSSVQVALYDITGRLIKTYADLLSQSAGSYKIEINEAVIGSVTGVYLLKIIINGEEMNRYLVHM